MFATVHDVPKRSAWELENPTGPDLDEYLRGRRADGRLGRPYVLRDIQRLGGPEYSHLSRVLNGRAKLSEEMLRRLARAMREPIDETRMAYSVTLARKGAAETE